MRDFGTGYNPPPSISTSDIIINVKTPPYLAYGDDSHDDTAAIQAAIDAATLAGGGTVYFPKGRYKTTSSILNYSRFVNLDGAGGPILESSGSGGAAIVSHFSNINLVVTCATFTTKYVTPSTNLSNIKIGQKVTGTGIQDNTIVVSKTDTQVILSKPATASSGAVSLTFGNLAALVFYRDSAAGDFLEASSVSHLTVYDTNAAASYGMYIEGLRMHSVIEETSVIGGDIGYYLYKCWGGRIKGLYNSSSRTKGVFIDDNNNNVTVDGLSVLNMGGSDHSAQIGLHVYKSANVVLIDIRVESNIAYKGVLLEACNSPTIVGMYWENTTAETTDAPAAVVADKAVEINACTGATIISPWINGDWLSGNVYTNYGIYVTGCKRTTIIGGQAINCATQSIIEIMGTVGEYDLTVIGTYMDKPGTTGTCGRHILAGDRLIDFDSYNGSWTNMTTGKSLDAGGIYFHKPAAYGDKALSFCTDGGTIGTSTGLTGTINSGERFLQTSSVSNIDIGTYLSIPGVTGGKKVVGIYIGATNVKITGNSGDTTVSVNTAGQVPIGTRITIAGVTGSKLVTDVLRNPSRFVLDSAIDANVSSATATYVTGFLLDTVADAPASAVAITYYNPTYHVGVQDGGVDWRSIPWNPATNVISPGILCPSNRTLIGVRVTTQGTSTGNTTVTFYKKASTYGGAATQLAQVTLNTGAVYIGTTTITNGTLSEKDLLYATVSAANGLTDISVHFNTVLR